MIYISIKDKKAFTCEMASFRLFTNIRQISMINNKSPIYKIIKNQHFFSSKPAATNSTQPTDSDQPAKKKKTVPIPRITLLSPDENVQVTSLEEAQKLAKRRDLKLVKIIDLDTKTQRPIYKLMTGAEYHAEDLKQRDMRKEKKNETIKGEKLLLINSKISEHDLESRMKNILKWINKKYEIRVVVSGDNVDSCEKIYNTIEETVKSDGRVLQKRIKGNELKFQIIPPKVVKTKEAPQSETL